jgi:hypothetical protein
MVCLRVVTVIEENKTSHSRYGDVCGREQARAAAFDADSLGSRLAALLAAIAQHVRRRAREVVANRDGA